ncbi:MAG TPA: hypothetical protein VKA63_05740 [Candidatus Krumholzibacteria bacterium]|nr:hypothetical protein [Candidatus Krumholzibacteria bacterium]
MEPLLRGMRRLVKREEPQEEGPAFPAAAERLFKDLQDVAALHENDARARLTDNWETLDLDSTARLGIALNFQRKSRLFHLSPNEHWAAVRAYLSGCLRHAVAVNPDLLDPKVDGGDEGRSWLCELVDDWLPTKADLLQAISTWLLMQLGPLADREGHPLQGQALALRCRILLLDPLGAPAALREGIFALQAVYPPRDPASLLRIVAGLACNEKRLAAAWADESTLNALAPLAKHFGLLWPPQDLVQLLQSRRPEDDKSVLAAVAWEGEPGGRVLLLKQSGCAPVDLVLLRPSDESSKLDDPFALSMTEALAAVDRWLPEDCLVLCGPAPPPWILSLFAERPHLCVGALETVFTSVEVARTRAEPGARHPIFSQAPDALSEQWSALAHAARELSPRLLSLAGSAALCSDWGLRNLEALGEVGLSLPRRLAQALRTLDVPASSEITELDALGGVARLEWPSLANRPWPGQRLPHIPIELSGSDALIAGHPSSGELMGSALSAAPCTVLSCTEERVLQLAAGLVGQVDARRVGVTPNTIVCPEPVFALLDGWIEESLVDEARSLDVLWLYHQLATTPDGDLTRWLSSNGRPEAREELLARLRECGSCEGTCRLAPSQSCWAEQVATRRRLSRVWLEWTECLERQESEPAGTRRLVCDDLVEIFAGLEDERALRVLDTLMERAAAAETVVAWCQCAPFGDALARELSRGLPEGRSFVPLAEGESRELALHLSPSGYAPGSWVLEQESRALIRLRVQAWNKRSPSARAWIAPAAAMGAWKDVAGNHPLSGTGKGSHEAVVVALLGPPGDLDRVLALLRLSAAASFASKELACVDPRLAELFGDAWSVSPKSTILTDPAPATGGAQLLDKSSNRAVPNWGQPFDLQRIAAVSARLGVARALPEERIRVLADAIGPMQRGGRRVLGGAGREDRVVLAWTAAALAEQSRDGGPLAAHFVVWLGQEDPDLFTDAPFEVAVAGQGEHQGQHLASELETGRIHLLIVPPKLLASPQWRSWLAGLRRCLVLFAEADRLLPSHPAHDPNLLATLRAIEFDSSLSCLALADQFDAGAGGPIAALAEELRAQAALIGSTRELEGWSWQRIRLEDPIWSCTHCEREQTLPHIFALCTHCGHALLSTPSDRAKGEQALRKSQVHWLSRQGLKNELLVIVEHERERDALRRDLGIVSQDELAPLLGGTWSVRVVVLKDLWHEEPPAGELIFAKLPRDPGSLRAALARLNARGRHHGTLLFMDHPLMWDGEVQGQLQQRIGELPPLSQLRWKVARAEVEFRAREALGRIERALRARGSRQGRFRRGLGPEGDPRKDARVSQLAAAVEIWRSMASEGLAVEEIQERGSREVVQTLNTLAAAGLSFESEEVCGSSLADLFNDTARREAARAFLGWCVSEGLLQAPEVEPHAAALALPQLKTNEVLHWRDMARSAPTGVPSALAPWPKTPPRQKERPSEAVEFSPSGAWLLGVPGSGRSRALFARTQEDPEAATPLVIVANTTGLLRWAEISRENELPAGRLLVVTMRELVLDFLRCHYELGGFERPPQILAVAPESEDLRRRLIRETSRRYAREAGVSPPVDLMDMRRVVEGGEGVALAAAGSEGLDLALLQRSAAEVRREGGYVLPHELGVLSRRWLVEHPYVGEAWRDRYPRVFVDDLDAILSDEAAFLDRLFPEGFRWAAADPALLPVGSPLRGDTGVRRSHRLPRELARAGEVLLREDLLGRGSIKARSRDKGRLSRQQVLNLEACVHHIESALSGEQWQRQRVGIVITYDGDLPRLASRLREAEIAVWPAAQVMPACVPGPRELLLALALAAKGPNLDPLMAGSLALALLSIAEVSPGERDPAELGEWLGKLFEAGTLKPLDPAEAYLQPLGELARSLERAESLWDAAQLLQSTRLLPRVEKDDAAAARLSAYLDERAAMPWQGVLLGLDPAGLVDPLAKGPRVWLLGAEELSALELDRGFYLCTGHEPAELHYRVLGRIKESLTVLYSERDPFASRL